MIIQATMRDLPALESLYAAARERMKAADNPDQWGDSYPPRALIEEDIARGGCTCQKRRTRSSVRSYSL